MFESDRWQRQISETAHFGLNAIRQVAKIRLEGLQEWDRRSWRALSRWRPEPKSSPFALIGCPKARR